MDNRLIDYKALAECKSLLDLHTDRELAFQAQGAKRMEKIEELEAEKAELLKSCRALLDMITDNRLHGAEVYKASAAIKNAEGGSG